MGEKYGKSGQATDGVMVRRMVCVSRMTMAAKTHLDYVIFSGFYSKICYTNAPKCYVICTLNMLLLLRVQEGGVTEYFEMNSIKISQHLTSCTL